MNHAEKVELASPNVAEQKRAQLKRCLGRAFPEVFADGALDFERLRRALGDWVEPGKERFGLSWPGKADCMRVIQQPSVATLQPERGASVDFDSTQNVFIEGENLEVLKLLQKSYAGQFKVIYIDPPYNTGKDFIYPDRYAEPVEAYLAHSGQVDAQGRRLSISTETTGRFHSRWLSMMYPRLYLARHLLRDDGLIFISIDDHEQSNLKLLCDEIFGEENFKGKVSRRTGTPSGQGHNILVNEVDYVLVYAKSAAAAVHGLPLGKEDERIYDQEDGGGRYLIRPLRKTGSEDRREDRPTMYFPVTDPEGNEVYPTAPEGYASRWRCGPQTYQELQKSNRILWKKVASDGQLAWKVYQKFYLQGRAKQPSNLWDDIEGNKQATRDVKTLFGRKVFDFPKPVELIERCLDVAGGDGGLVLDFFAGSATTAHAVLRKNASSGKSFRFVVVQLPEPCDESSEAFKAGYRTIAEIGRERVRLCARQELYTHRNRASLLDVGFRVFRLSPGNPRDVLYELVLKAGFPLTTTISSVTIAQRPVFSVQDGAMLVCLEKQITPELIAALAQADARQVVCLAEAASRALRECIGEKLVLA